MSGKRSCRFPIVVLDKIINAAPVSLFVTVWTPQSLSYSERRFLGTSMLMSVSRVLQKIENLYNENIAIGSEYNIHYEVTVLNPLNKIVASRKHAYIILTP